jgi:alpha-N-acetylglucosamine transferase
MYPLRESWAIKVLILTPLTLLLISFLWLTSTRYYSDHLEVVHHYEPVSHDEFVSQKHHHNASSTSKHAFATFLSGYNGTDSEKYFTAVKLLTYQLIHDPPTRTREGTPFIVLVTKDVEQERQDILRHGGATVISVDDVERDWFQPTTSRWEGVMAKLNIWSLTDYEKVVFVDADTVILKPMDEIFSIPATDIRDSLPAPPEAIDPLASMSVTSPQKYLMAGIHDIWIEQNKKPLENETFYEVDHYMNAGFFVISPSKEMFGFYLSLLENPVPFNLKYPEQNLLNFAHRTDGQMPWQVLNTTWNDITQLNPSYNRNARSLHHKWWVELSDKPIQNFIKGAMERMDETEVNFAF